MTHPTPAGRPRDGAAVEEHLDAIQLRYEEAEASIIARGGDDPLPDTEAIDLWTIPPVPPGARDDQAPPAAVFHDNVVADVPGRRRWWRFRLHDGGAGRR